MNQQAQSEPAGPSQTCDVLILGAGVMGLMLACEMAEQGRSVIILDRFQAARGASWAGGGIVSPLYPWRYGPGVTQLATWSQGYYPQLAKALHERTLIDPEYREGGLLLLDIEDAEQARAWSQQHKRNLHALDAQQIYALEPELAPGFDSGQYMPEVGSIRNPRLLQALLRSVQLNRRIKLVEKAGDLTFTQTGSRVSAVHSASQGRFSAGHVVLSAGAWSAPLLHNFGLALPVKPIRGQMLVYQAPSDLVQRISLVNNRYVIPRRDGRVLVGSTLEDEGYNAHTTVDARWSLSATAEQIIPALAGCRIEKHWAGLRPSSPDGVPFIGAVPGVDNLYCSAGHYRNGLVLAPASTHLLSAQLRGAECSLDARPYRLEGRVEAL